MDRLMHIFNKATILTNFNSKILCNKLTVSRNREYIALINKLFLM